MKGRPIDCSKPKNIKCEHCDYWTCTMELFNLGTCLNTNSQWFEKSRKYWNMCKQFNWRDDKEYINRPD